MSIFKAYDIRGIYGKELTDRLAYEFGRAFVSYLGCKVVVVGRDMRESSPQIEKQLIRGILDQGCDVVKLGLVTTPMMYYTVAKYGYDAGINITASHNPSQYNGFKLVRKDGVPIGGETGIYEIENILKAGKFKEVKKGKAIDRNDILDSYVKNALSYVDIDKLRDFKLVVDTANGMAGIVIPKLLAKIRCNYKHLFSELDGRFPNHEANPLKTETLKWLQEAVKEENADLGVAFDGDSDRIGFVDEKGDVVQADLIIALVANYLLKKNKGAKILYDLRSSRAVLESIKEGGGIPIETKVGHSLIKAHMRKENAIFGGELSAHYYLKDNFYIESPYIVLLILLWMITESKKNMSELIEPLHRYHSTGEINFKVNDSEKAMAAVKEYFKDAERIYMLDGVSIVYSDWWLNLRKSNTESLLRLNLEAKTKEKRDEMKAKIIELFSRIC